MSKKSASKKRGFGLAKLVFMACLIYFAITFISQQFKINEYAVKEKYYSEQIDETKKKTEDYNSITDQAKSVEYIESIARDNLGLVKPYEKIFIDVNK